MTSLRELSHDGAVRECLLTQLTPLAPHRDPPVDRTCLAANARSTERLALALPFGVLQGSSRSLRAERAVCPFTTFKFRGLLLLLAPSESRVTRAAGSY